MSETIIPDTTDSRVGTTFRVGPWTVTVDTESDCDAGSPADDGDWATDAQVAAWKRDDWAYVILTVTASREGIELGRSGLGSVESGWFTYTDEADNVTGHGYVGPYTEAVDACIAEAIADAEATLARLCTS